MSRKQKNIKFNQKLYILDAVVEPHNNKQLHITLAYKFMGDQLKKLEALASKIDLNKDTKWEIRLYSRDARFNGCEVVCLI